MSDEDWVARLLGAAERPTMPADVADRLERTVRQHIDLTGPGTAANRPGTASTRAGVPLRPDVGDGPVESSAASSPSGPSTTTPGVVPAPAVVPPAAGPGAGVAAPLRAGTADEQPTGAVEDAAPAGQARTQQGRTFGSSRKEQLSDDEGERRRKLLTRWLPVAAGVLVLGAAGAAAVNVLDGSDGSDGSVVTADEAAAGDVAAAVAPRALLATGTEYTTADPEVFSQQVRDLVVVARSGTEGSSAAAEAAPGGADAAAADEPDPATASAPLAADPEAARASVADNPLADAAALQECIEAVTDGTDDTATAVDLALVNGVESTVVVVPDPAGTDLFVYVVGPDCTGIDSQFQFFTVTP